MVLVDAERCTREHGPETADTHDPAAEAEAGEAPSANDDASMADPAANSQGLDLTDPTQRRAAAERCMHGGPCDPEFWLAPTDEDLATFARCGWVLTDAPIFFHDARWLTPHHAMLEATGLGESEIERYEDVAKQFDARAASRLRSLIESEAGGGPLLDNLDTPQLFALARKLVDPATEQDLRRRLANERAGLATAPPREAQSPQEQIYRFTAELGDDFEAELADNLDPAVARELRRSWGGVREAIGDQCSEPESP
jgi:hypothetical protein